MKAFLIIILVFGLSACGKKGVVMEPSSMGIVDALTFKKDFTTVKIVNEQVCIDDLLESEINEKEYVKRVITDADISYCDGLRVRMKVYKMNDGKLRVYGFALSTSGKSSCLRDGKDFNKVFFLGYEGTLKGDGINISLGGHSYTPSKTLIKSEKRRSGYVNFNVASFKGEMGFFENNKLVCWANK